MPTLTENPVTAVPAADPAAAAASPVDGARPGDG